MSAGPFIQKIKLSKQKNLSRLLEQEYSFSKWGAFSSFSQSKKKNPQVVVFESKEDQNKIFTLGWKKDIPYGLSLKTSYSDLSRSQVHPEFLKRIKSSEQTYRKNLNMELNANLNSALAQHWTFEAIGKGKKLNEWLYYEKTEELALKSATQYWKSYLAWTAYNQAQEGLKTYKRLVRQIHRKKRYGFLKPGERPQILAEYENIKQETDKQKQNYENEKKALLLFIKRDPDRHDIQFKEEKLKPLPHFPKIKIENTRILKIKKMKIREQELQLKISRMELFPSLELSGKGVLFRAPHLQINCPFPPNSLFMSSA